MNQFEENRFIGGDSIDLHSPIDQDFASWASWFNDPRITKYLLQGEFPNTDFTQRNFYRDALEKKNRILLMIKSKKNRSLLGVISLNNIDFKDRIASIATVLAKPCRAAPLAGLEARALMLTHSFDRLGLNCVYGAVMWPGNKRWMAKNLVLGFRPEGVSRSVARRGQEYIDVMRYSILFRDYRALCEKRGGSLWPSETYIRERLNRVKGEKYLDTFATFVGNQSDLQTIE